MPGRTYLAVLASVLAHQMLGFLWYGVLPWAGPRVQALGKPLSELQMVDPLALAIDVAGWVLASYTIAWLVRRFDIVDAASGAALGVALGIGIGLPALVPHYAFAGIAPLVTIVDAANLLVALGLSGAIVAALAPAPSYRSAARG